jgi:hypothetical protein
VAVIENNFSSYKQHFLTGFLQGNACYHSVQNLSSCLFSKNSKIHKSITLLVSYGCETWSLTLRENHGLRVFENRVLKRIFGPKREDV